MSMTYVRSRSRKLLVLSDIGTDSGLTRVCFRHFRTCVQNCTHFSKPRGSPSMFKLDAIVWTCAHVVCLSRSRIILELVANAAVPIFIDKSFGFTCFQSGWGYIWLLSNLRFHFPQIRGFLRIKSVQVVAVTLSSSTCTKHASKCTRFIRPAWRTLIHERVWHSSTSPHTNNLPSSHSITPSTNILYSYANASTTPLVIKFVGLEHHPIFFFKFILRILDTPPFTKAFAVVE